MSRAFAGRSPYPALDFTDATIVAIGERLALTTIATTVHARAVDRPSVSGDQNAVQMRRLPSHASATIRAGGEPRWQ